MALTNNTTTLLDLWRRRGTQTNATSNYGFVFNNTSGRTQSGVNVSVENLLTDATIVSGVNAIAKGISQIPMEAKRKESDGRKVILPDSDLQMLLDRPNVFQTPSEFKQTIVTSLIINGNCFIRIIRVGDKVMQLIPMDPDDISIGSTSGGFPSYTHDQYGDIPLEDIVHIRDVTTWSPQGNSRLLLAAERIGALRAADKLMSRTFKNGISINYAVETAAEMNADAAAAFSEQLKKLFGENGSQNGGVMLLGDGATVQQLKGATPADADIRALRQDLIREIAAVFGVPAYMLGTSGDEKYNNIRQKNASFTRDTLMPIMVNIQEALTLKLSQGNEIIEFNPTEFVKGAVNEQAIVANSLVSGGIWTQNEGRRFMDMNPVDDPAADILIPPNSSTNTNIADDEAATGGEDGPQSLDNRPERGEDG